MSDTTRVATIGRSPQDVPTWPGPCAWSIDPARLLAPRNDVSRPAHPRPRLLESTQLAHALDPVRLLGRGPAATFGGPQPWPETPNPESAGQPGLRSTLCSLAVRLTTGRADSET